MHEHRDYVQSGNVVFTATDRLVSRPARHTPAAAAPRYAARVEVVDAEVAETPSDHQRSKPLRALPGRTKLGE
jgi:uncharacterized protein (DUF1697 family)